MIQSAFLVLAMVWFPGLGRLLHAEEITDDGELGNAIVDVFRTSGTVSYEQEATMGETIALQAFAKFGHLSTDQQLLEYVAVVGNTIALVSQRPNIPYYFSVCENADPNAFSVPGGYVFLTTGLLKLLKNEEELAGVLGHEVAQPLSGRTLRDASRPPTAVRPDAPAGTSPHFHLLHRKISRSAFVTFVTFVDASHMPA